MTRNHIQLYVLGERVDLYESDSISIVSKIQDIRDISKVFTDFTHSFSVPGSAKNNRTFKHIFRNDHFILDPRQYHEAVLEINNQTFKRGFVQFEEGILSSGKSNEYKLRFYGGLALLPRLFSDDKLRQLDGSLDIDLTYGNNVEFNDLWYGLLTTSNNSDIRISLNAFNDGFVYNSAWTTNRDDNGDFVDSREGYRNIAYFQDNDVNNRSDVGVELHLLKPAIKADKILQAIESRYNILFSRGIDASGRPTSVNSEVVTDHFFNDYIWLNEWTLLHNKSVDESLTNEPAIPLIWSSQWGNVTPDVPSPTFFEAFANRVIIGGGLAALGGLTGGAAFLLLGPSSGTLLALIAAGQGAITTGAIIGGSAGVASALFDGDASIQESAFGNEEEILFYHEDDDRGDVRLSRYYVSADITKVGSGAYRVYLQDADGNILWDTERQTQRYLSQDDEDARRIRYDASLSGGGFVYKNGATRANRPEFGTLIDFPTNDPRIYTAKFFIQKQDGVSVNADVSIIAELLTKTRGVIFRDFQRDWTITRNMYSGFTGNAEFSIPDSLPNIKVVDWLTGHWKKNNLTAYVERDAQDRAIITTKTLDQFYADGSVLDLTEWVNNQEVVVKAPEYFSPIIFKYQDPSTFLAQEFENKTLRKYGYGSLSHELNTDNITRLPYKEYRVELPFEQVILTPIQDEALPETDTDIVFGWIVSDSQSPTQLKYFPHYIESVTANVPFLVKELGNDLRRTTTYNAQSKYLRRDGETIQTLTFGQENDERTTEQNTSSYSPLTLFNVYHSNFIATAFSSRAKIYKFDARLPSGLLANLNLADAVVIGNDAYRINEFVSNISDGKTKLELYSIDNARVPDSFGVIPGGQIVFFTIDTFFTNITNGVHIEGLPAEFIVTLLNSSDPSFELIRTRAGSEITVDTNETGVFTTFDAIVGDTFFVRATDRGFVLDTRTVTITEVVVGNIILDHNNDPITDNNDNQIIDNS